MKKEIAFYLDIHELPDCFSRESSIPVTQVPSPNGVVHKYIWESLYGVTKVSSVLSSSSTNHESIILAGDLFIFGYTPVKIRVDIFSCAIYVQAASFVRSRFPFFMLENQKKSNEMFLIKEEFTRILNFVIFKREGVITSCFSDWIVAHRRSIICRPNCRPLQHSGGWLDVQCC